jgi:hypothetical protein
LGSADVFVSEARREPGEKVAKDNFDARREPGKKVARGKCGAERSTPPLDWSRNDEAPEGRQTCGAGTASSRAKAPEKTVVVFMVSGLAIIQQVIVWSSPKTQEV